MPAENDPKSGMGRSWKSTLRAETREEAEQRLRDIGYEWEWLPDGSLRATTPVLPAVREVWPGPQDVFQSVDRRVSGLEGRSQRPVEGDSLRRRLAARSRRGERRDRAGRRTGVRSAVAKGDAVLVDNFVTMHGRRTFRGTRKVLASLADPQTRSGGLASAKNSQGAAVNA